MEGIDPTSPHRQTALAMAALAVAFAKTLQEVESDEEVSVCLYFAQCFRTKA
jgi:hypothetical protein